MTATVIDFSKLADTVKQKNVCPHCGGTANCKCEDAEAVFENNWLELQRFIYGDMSEEEGTEYLGGIGWVLILGPEQEPLGLMGQTDWGWIDTLNETAHFLLPRGYETKLIPELDDWGFDTSGLMDSIAEYSITGCSSDGSVTDKPPLKKIVH